MSEPIFTVKSVTLQKMLVYEDKIELFGNAENAIGSRVFEGKKTIYYNDISSVRFKNCGLTAGFLEFTFAGGLPQNKGGFFKGLGNDYRFTFGAPTFGLAKKKAKEMDEVYQYIQARMNESKTGKASSPVSQFSGADEIKKYKQLLDDGIISQKEFEAKKKQLLEQ